MPHQIRCYATTSAFAFLGPPRRYFYVVLGWDNGLWLHSGVRNENAKDALRFASFGDLMVNSDDGDASWRNGGTGVRPKDSRVWRFHRGKSIAAKGKPSRGDEMRYRSSTYRARIVL